MRATLLVSAALLWASSAHAEEAPGRVLSVVEAPGPFPGEVVEELRVHLHRSHPTAAQGQDIAGITPEQRAITFARIASDPPQAMVLLGPATVGAALERAWPSTELIFAGLGEHGVHPTTVPRGVIESCPAESLLLLARRLAPNARSIGWIRPAKDPLSGALWASLQEATEAQQLRLGRLDLAADNLAPLDGFVRQHDAFVLLYPLVGGELRREIIRGTVGARKPLFTCDSASVGAGAVASLVPDAQQVGEALGALAADVLDGKPPRRIQLDSGLIAVNVRSACVTGIMPSAELLQRAVVYDRNAGCPAPPGPSYPWLPLLSGALAASLLGFWLSRRG